MGPVELNAERLMGDRQQHGSRQSRAKRASLAVSRPPVALENVLSLRLLPL